MEHPDPYSITYGYAQPDAKRRSVLPSTMGIGGRTLKYTYDGNGNITKITDTAPGGQTKTVTYQYDELNQLTRENNGIQGKTIVYSYDKGGNLTSVKTYPYTEASALTAPLETETGSYDQTWKDKLQTWKKTDNNGKETSIGMTYDAIGNMLTKGSVKYTWTQGRKLASVDNGKKIQYFYDHTGNRTKKVVDGVTTQFRMAGDLLASERRGTEKTLWYRYDSSGNVMSVTYNGTLYIYVRNLQNDIIAIIDGKGNEVVGYTYDSWGKVTEITGSMKDTLGERNPFRYRGYYYDTEIGMYYLKSRYYDPEIRRFISADTLISKSPKGTNIFTYCENNPVNMADYSGYVATEIVAGGFLFVFSLIASAVVNSKEVRKSSRNFVDSVSRTIVDSRRSATDYWRHDYQERTEERMKNKLAVLQRDEKQNNHIHHIVAANAVMAEPARNILERVNISVNNPINLVSLSPIFHMRLHTNIYYGMINLEMIDAYYHPLAIEMPEKSVENRLKEIKKYLKGLDGAW